MRPMTPDLGDMDPASFRTAAEQVLDWAATYLRDSDRYAVSPRVEPGCVRAALPSQAPECGERFDAIPRDFTTVIVPALTHWNHPGFLAYFSSSGSGPGVLGEWLAAAVNQQAMLWQTSPAATEL